VENDFHRWWARTKGKCKVTNVVCNNLSPLLAPSICGIRSQTSNYNRSSIYYKLAAVT